MRDEWRGDVNQTNRFRPVFNPLATRNLSQGYPIKELRVSLPALVGYLSLLIRGGWVILSTKEEHN